MSKVRIFRSYKMVRFTSIAISLIRAGAGLSSQLKNTMQLLQSVRGYFATLGINICSSQTPPSKWNWRNLGLITSLAQLAISSAAFIFFEAGTPAEYGYSICQMLNGCAAIALISICLWKCEKTFKLLEQFEDFIDRSE